MAIVISKTKEAPAVYGANETSALPGLNSVVAANMIGFGKGSLESVLAHVGEENPSTKVYFGFDSTTGAGAIVSNGKLVSSKVLDIVVTPEADGVAPKLAVKYVDAENKNVSTVDLPLVSAASVAEALAAAKTYADTRVGAEETARKAQIGDLGKVSAEEGAADHTVKSYVDAAVAGKNVLAEGETGDAALVSASADANKVTVASTQKLKDAVDIAEKLDGAVTLEGSVKAQIAALKKEIMTGDATEAVNTAYDTLLEISKWIGDDTTGHIKDAADMATDIAANKTAIGTAGTPASGTEGSDGYVPAVPGTGLTGRVEALEAKKHVTSDVSAEEGKYISGIKVAADGAVTITETALPKITIATDSVDYVSVDSDDKHKIGVKTTALGTAVGLTKGTDGTWSAANGTTSDAPGLATAADVAAEIVADEEVIAAALNEHEMRIKTLEAADAVHTTVADKTTGHIKVATGEGKVVTISEDADAVVKYTAATETDAANLEASSAALLLNGSAIAAIKNYVDAVLAAKVSDLEAKLAAETTRATNAENALVEVVNALNSALTWTEA